MRSGSAEACGERGLSVEVKDTLGDLDPITGDVFRRPAMTLLVILGGLMVSIGFCGRDLKTDKTKEIEMLHCNRNILETIEVCNKIASFLS